MRKKPMMSRQLFIALMVSVEALCILIAIAFYAYNAFTLKDSEKARLASLCSNTTSQVDAMVHSMDELSLAISTADGFLQSMRALAGGAKDDDSARVLQGIMSKAYVNKTNVYRIVALAGNGKCVSLGRNELTEPELKALVADGYWHQTDRRGNSKVLVGPFSDPFVKVNPPEIFSLLRAVRDGDNLLGYIEVQMMTSHITQIYQDKWRLNNLFYAILDGEGTLFFSNFDPAEKAGYMDVIRKNAAWYPTDSIETPGEIVSISSSNYSDWKTAMVMPKSDLYRPLQGMLPIALAFSLLMGLAMAGLFKLIVDRITKPMKHVVAQVEAINLDSLGAPFERVSGSYEAEVLSDAFHMMKLRLLEAFKREKIIEHMQTKVLLEALQSRIGPHFLNNTLGSIANMCEAGDLEGAADACFSLSDLIRYSSNYTTDLVTVREELEHLRDYLLLMKGRYRHRLNYAIEADSDCQGAKILKLTIQPLIENAIKYSLSESEQVEIHLRLWREGGRMHIRVSDNGMGFDEAVLAGLGETIARFLENPSRFSEEESGAMRGMGLAGTLMRLFRLFGQHQFAYRIENLPMGGAAVELMISYAE